MWIVLLDHSGSMGEPFEGSFDKALPRLRQTESEIKLAAAKEVIAEEMEELGDDVQVVIFGFTSQAELLFEGPASRRGEIRSNIASVQAGGGTDIAAALNAAADYNEGRHGGGVPRVVLISDGKSDKAESMLAARRCAHLSMGIHFILIDPTEVGEAFRREVVGAVGGTSESVTSRTQLKDATQRATRAYRQDQARAEQFLKTAEMEAEVLRKATENRRRIAFTSGYAGRIQPANAYPLIVYVHLAEMRREVEERLAKAGDIFGELPRKSEAETNQLFPVGTNLEITPRITNLAVNPAQQTLTWLGEIDEALFRVHYVGPDETTAICSGFIDITTSGLIVAQIPVSISVAGDHNESSFERISVEMFSRVFASYAREDATIVGACKAAYRALGIQLFVDKDDLLTGQSWREVIRRSIANHDLFQLFWSTFAADSTEVANEWHLALEIEPQRKWNFLRPVYWSKPMVEPPGELKHLNFGFLDLGAFKGQVEPGLVPVPPVERGSGRNEATFPVVEVIKCNANAVETLRKDLSTVIPFLEHVVGTRYYPPVTFLVDEQLVRTLHAVSRPMKQSSNDPDSDQGDMQAVIAFLQSLALGFHTGRLIGQDKAGFGQRHIWFEALDSSAKAEFDHVQRMSEYLFSGPLREYLAGRNVLNEGRATLEQALRDLSNKRGDGWEVRRLLENLLEIATPIDRIAVAGIAGKNDMEVLGSFEEDKSAEVARKLLASELPQLASKYRIELFFGQSDMSKLRLERTFVEYIRGFCDRWLSFVDVALRKRGNAVVDVGYSAPEAALRRLENEAPDIQIIRKKQDFQQNSSEEKSYYEINLRDYKFCVDMLSKRLVERLKRGAKPQGQIFLPVIASTYGIFLPRSAEVAQAQFEDTLARLKWPSQAALRGQDKVLICIGAIDRLSEQMQQASPADTKATDLAHRFALAVLVHEHFHSALATGIDQNGYAPLGPRRPDEWQNASNLNESLAAWVELHYFRDDPEMLEQVNAYIRRGEYPQWPYRGAQTIETFYEQGGLPTVRGWVKYLQDDPINAQTEFDQRVSRASI